MQPKHLLLNKSFRRCFSIFLDARKRKMASPVIQKQKFDYFLVLDFEATCDDKVAPKPQVRSTGNELGITSCDRLK